VLISESGSEHGGHFFPGLKHKKGGQQILDPSSSVSPRNGNKDFDITGEVDDDGGGNDSDEGEDNTVNEAVVGLTLSLKECLEVIAKGDGNDGETGTDGKYWKQGDEVFDPDPGRGDLSRLGVVGREVEGIQILQFWKGKDGSHGYEDVEHHDEDVIDQHHQVDLFFIFDWRNERGEGVVAHEGINASPKEAGDLFDAGGHLGVGIRPLAKADEGDHDHHRERNPPQGGCADLQIFGLLYVEESEGGHADEEDGQEDLVDVESGQGWVVVEASHGLGEGRGGIRCDIVGVV